jgi:crotonobetainyl-CoA:carnitine CoA-transferase CaiB-like acyl-CoA transferase
MAMLDVAMILMASHVTGYLRNGKHPKPSGNRTGHATSMAYQTAEGMVMLGASNLRQQKRLWTVLERPEMIKRTNDERNADHDREEEVLTAIMLTRPAAEWEIYLQDRHIPASRVRTMQEALDDPQIASRGLLHRQDGAPGIEGSFSVPVAAFTFAHDGPRVDRPPPMFGQHNDEVLAELGYSAGDIAGFRSAKII